MDNPSSASDAPTADSVFNEETAVQAPSIRAGTRADARRALLPVAIAAAYLALYRVTLYVPFGEAQRVVATLVALALAIAFAVAVARAVRSGANLALQVIVALALYLPFMPLALARGRMNLAPALRAAAPLLTIYGRLLTALPGLQGLIFIWLAALLGVCLSRLVREAKILLPIAVVLACVDLYVVFGGGLVKQAVSGKAPAAAAAMHSLTLPLLHPRMPRGAPPMDLSVGFADFMFIALFFAAFSRLGIRSGATFAALTAILLLYLLAVFFLNVPLPALVPIAIVVIGFNLSAFRYTRSELFALAYAGLLVAVVAALLFWMSRGR